MISSIWALIRAGLLVVKVMNMHFVSVAEVAFAVHVTFVAPH
jgi:hypothetical protein